MTCAHGGLISETRKKSIHVGLGSCFGHDIRTLWRGTWKWTRIGIWLLRFNARIRGRWGEHRPRLLRFDTIIYGDGSNPPTSPSILLRILPSVPSLEVCFIICRSKRLPNGSERSVPVKSILHLPRHSYFPSLRHHFNITLAAFPRTLLLRSRTMAGGCQVPVRSYS